MEAGNTQIPAKIRELSFSLLNVNTINDRKTMLMNPLLEKFHFQFFTELNIETTEKLNTVKSSDLYEWVIISKESDFSQRIGLRFCKSMSKYVKIEVVKSKYLSQEKRSVNQKDKSVVQLLHLSIRCYHVSFTCILVYRTPDCNAENRDLMFEFIDSVNPHIALGDVNLDLKKKENVKIVNDKLSLTQVVKKPTRITKKSKTLIDHVYVRENWKSKIKHSVVKVESIIADHCLVECYLSALIPPVKLKIPQVLDPHRRYFPRNQIDWNNVSCSFKYEEYEKLDVEFYYEKLKDCMIFDCERNDITFRKKLAPRRVFRFNMSEKCRDLKKRSKHAKYVLRITRQHHAEAMQYFDECVGTVFELEMTSQLEYYNFLCEHNLEFYRCARNEYNQEVRRECNNAFKDQFAKNKNNTKKLWEIANRSKGIITKSVEELSDPNFHPVAMANFFQERSKIGLTDNDEDVNYSNVYKDLDFRTIVESVDNFCRVDVEITDAEIDIAMRHKPSSAPDPDSLSMGIWNKFYFNNAEYKVAIRILFKKCINLESKIPGLKNHNVSLYLKKPVALVQKDLRPVASFESLSKRMLRYVTLVVKKAAPTVFFAENEYSQPGMGCMVLVMCIYERAQESFFARIKPPNTKLGEPNKMHKKGTVRTSFVMYDKSNAYCTFKKDVAVKNLELSGNSRQILCHALLSQE